MEKNAWKFSVKSARNTVRSYLLNFTDLPMKSSFERWSLSQTVISSSSLEITYLYCVRCWFYTLYVVYCRMYCTHRACTVSGAVYSVCCVQYCTVCTLYCVRCCVDVSGLASERSHQLYHVYCILYSVCTVAGAVLTCLAWLVRGPTSCG